MIYIVTSKISECIKQWSKDARQRKSMKEQFWSITSKRSGCTKRWESWEGRSPKPQGRQRQGSSPESEFMKVHKVDRKHNSKKKNLQGKRRRKSNLTNRSVEFVVKGAQETEDSLQRPHTSKYSSYISWVRSWVCVRDILSYPLWIYLSRQRKICHLLPLFWSWSSWEAERKEQRRGWRRWLQGWTWCWWRRSRGELGSTCFIATFLLGNFLFGLWVNIFIGTFLLGNFLFVLWVHFLLQLFNGAFRIFRPGVII